MTLLSREAALPARQADAGSTATSGTAPPLCVDLDGTLVLGDLLFESLIMLAMQRPLSLLLLPLWLLRGRAAVKAEIASRVRVDVQLLPYNHVFIHWLQSERACGRRIWLCTAANEILAHSVADHLQLFDGVMASNHAVNLSGARKAASLVERFGEGGFDYCGNERCDIEIWKRARGAIVVNANDHLLRDTARYAMILRTF